MVNLTGVTPIANTTGGRRGGLFLDPFVGTGGLVIEGLCGGIASFGSDISDVTN